MLSLDFSQKLNRINLTPDSLSYKGTPADAVFSQPCVAIVGSRKPTPYGREVTKQLVMDLVKAGVVIISGLAFGIDSIAHTQALDSDGITVAVLPSGLEAIYPASHRGLAEKITEQGILISEYPASHRPFKHDFLSRNRIIAALSDVVIIPEAADRSGSLNTARQARDLGIPVYAVPGRLHDHMSRGTNHLIAHGDAKLCLSSEHVLKSLGLAGLTATEGAQKPSHLTNEQLIIYELLEQGDLETSALQVKAGLPIDQILTHLTFLELNGLIQQNLIGAWHIQQ